MRTENFIRCYEVLREEIGNLCKLNCEIWDIEDGKQKVTKAVLKEKKATYALSKEHFRGMYDMANLTGEFDMPSGDKSGIELEFGWLFT